MELATTDSALKISINPINPDGNEARCDNPYKESHFAQRILQQNAEILSTKA